MRRVFAALLILVPFAALLVAVPPVLGRVLFSMGFTSTAARLLGDPGWRGYTLARDGRYVESAAAFGKVPANAYNRGNALTQAGLYKAALDAYDDALEADPEDEDARHNKAIIEKILDSGITPPGAAKGNANAASTRERRHGGLGDQEGDTTSTGIGFVGNKEGSSTSGSQGGSKVPKMGKGEAQATESDSSKARGSAGLASGRGRTGGDLVDITAQLAANQRRYSPMFTARAIQPNIEWLQTGPDDPGRFLKLQIRAEQKRRQAHENNDGDD